MKKIKIAVAIMAFILGILIFNTKVDAAVTYTRNIPNNDGGIILNLKGLTLDTKKAYSYALVTRGGKPETWHTMTEYTETTAKVNLGSSTKDILEVLKLTDTGILYVKDDATGTYAVDGLEVNLKLPYMKAANVVEEQDGTIAVKPIYGYSGTSYFKFQKITNKTSIEKYLNYKNNGVNYSESDFTQTEPNTGFSSNWSFVYSNSGEHDIFKSLQPKDGLYYLWVKYTNDNCKDIVGYYIYDGKPEATKLEEYLEGIDVVAPTVKSIYVSSPASGTYKTNQTVKIRVNFSEKITGTTVPTLKIKFGESTVRSVNNGVIKDNYIEYSYNIQASDKGQLSTVGLEGGAIKDASGNVAKLSCPIISGNTIKANVEGTTTNNTDNEDKNNNNGSNGNNGGTNNSNNGNKGTTGNKGDTTIAGNLPKTGVSMAIVIAIIAVLGCAVLGYVKYNSYKDIK